MGKQQQQQASQQGNGGGLYRASRAFTVWTEGELPLHGPVLIVLRTMASPRHVLCQLGERRDMVCDVRLAVNFRKGMMIFGARRKAEGGDRAWEYLGKLPRRSGKW
jgi:hypothetical protein